MASKSPGNMDQAERVESGLHKLSRFIQAANLPYAHQFLDALDLSAADSAALARAVEELYRPTSLDLERALFAFEASHPGADVQALGDLGNRIVESHQQFLATGAWYHVLKRLHDASPTFHLKGFDEGYQRLPSFRRRYWQARNRCRLPIRTGPARMYPCAIGGYRAVAASSTAAPGDRSAPRRTAGGIPRLGPFSRA